jgi:predicted nucleic acid-binding protein
MLLTHAFRTKAVLDACVLYSAPLRDYLLSLANEGLYHPLWSHRIQHEWIRSLLKNRADLTEDRLLRTAAIMNSVFPNAEVQDFDDITATLSLPDENDNHVLAAALKRNADFIITFNLDDFPIDYVSGYRIIVQHPDEFIQTLIGFDEERTTRAFQRQVGRLTRPKQTQQEVLRTLASNGLDRSVARLKQLLGYTKLLS